MEQSKLQEQREFTYKQFGSYKNLSQNAVNNGDELQRAIMYFKSLTDSYHNINIIWYNMNLLSFVHPEFDRCN